MAKLILAIIDFFYPVVRKFMPIQTFRYAVCGGGNMVLGLLIFTIFHNYVFDQQVVAVGSHVFEPYVAALFISSSTIFVVGFLLNKYVVFTDSFLKGRIQLFRYFMSFMFNLFLNYLLLKLLVKKMYLNADLAQVIVTAIIVLVSYMTQKYFTFRTTADKN